MLAILYLCVCAITGMVLVAICVPDVRRLYLACAPSVKAIENIPSTLFVVTAGTVSGMMVVPFVNYYVILGLSYFVASDKLCMKIGFMVTAALFLWLVLTCLIIVNRRRIKKDEEETAGFAKLPGYVNKASNTLFYSFFILLTAIVSAFLMFYTYRIDRGYLINGYSTFSDLSPHTAMVSSFGKGFNFPTQYMHFSGDGINYHFLFYFLAGMLEYLGFPIDYALNIPSIIAMVCAMTLLGLLAALLSGKRLAFALSPVLVFLRSSLNVFIHIRNLMAEGQTITDAVGNILSESAWYEVTPYDSWGVWAINVYPNQRHLMLGVAVIILCVILFIPFVRRLCISVMSAGSFGGIFKAFLFSRNAWLPRKDDPLSSGTVALFTCLLVIVMPYFHGSCLISLLLILFGMALISESRLLHLMVAVCAVCSSYIQTLALSGGASNVVKLQFMPGFLYSEDTTVINAATLLKWGGYLITVTGATLIIAILCNVILLFHDIVKKKPVYRFFLMLAFLNPLVFAFIFQVSLEMLANHKFVQVSLILVDAFVAIFLANLFIVPGRRKAAVALAADADIAEDTEDEEDSEDTQNSEKLEEKAEKAEKEGELAPVILDKDKKEDEDKSGDEDSEDEPFEVLTDSDDDEDLPEEIAKDSDDEKTEESKEDKDKDEKPEEDEKPSEDSKSGDDSEKDDDRVLERFPSETTVSMRPGNIINSDKEEESDKDEKPAEEEAPAKEEPKASEDSDDSIPKEDTVSMRPGNLVNASDEETPAKEETAEDTKSEKAEDSGKTEEKTETSEESEKKESSEASDDSEKKDKEESSEDTEELPFEVLDDDDEEDKADKSEEKSLDTVKEDKEEKDIKDADDKSEKDVSEEDDDEDEDKADMVLEHHEIVSDKNKGLPAPVWVIFEIFGVLAALILLVGLTGTGISEWATYININSTPMVVNTNSPVTEWILKNTEPDDVFLTPEWSMNRFLLTGRAMYYGWPYYAWSAGHDTNTRDKIYVWLITGCGGDINEFKRYCKERGIRYLIADPEFDDGDYGEGVYFNREFFEQNLQQVAYFTEENTVIYKIY